MITTPKPWPELTVPTVEQWLAWLHTCTPEEQLEIAARVLSNNDAAMRCVLLDHDRLREELISVDRVLQGVVAQRNRYRVAWHSARRRGWWAIQRRLDQQEAGRR